MGRAEAGTAGNHSWIIPALLPSSLMDLSASEAAKTWNFSSTALPAPVEQPQAGTYQDMVYIYSCSRQPILTFLKSFPPGFRTQDTGIVLMVSGRHRALKLLGIVLFF